MENALSAIQIFESENIKISYRRIGKGARRILFFHGFPGSSAQVEAFRPHADRFDLDVICVDRPGYGGTVASGPNQFDEMTRVTEALLGSLGWSSYELMSVSGGTPFLFSCLRGVRGASEAVRRVTIVSGLGPIATKDFENLMNWKTKRALQALIVVPGRVFMQALPLNGTRGLASLGLISVMLPASQADKTVFREPRVPKILLQSLREAFQQSGEGPKRDARSYLSAWTLDVGDYRGPVDIWHGSEDIILSPAMAERMASVVPGARLKIVPNEGHYSLAIKRIADILAG